MNGDIMVASVRPTFEGHHGVVLKTSRTVLRAYHDSDLESLHQKIFAAAEVMKWAFGGHVLSRQQSADFIRAHFNAAPSPTGLAVLVDRSDGTVLGIAGLDPCRVLEEDDLEIGFVLASEVWGRGLATEIGQAQLAFGFDQMGRQRMLALAAGENVASIRILQKLGMRYHSSAEPSGRALRQVYCLGVEEWRRGGAE